MIGIIFQFGTEIIEVKVQGVNVLFRASQFTNFADIDGIKLNKVGVLKEFPDLKDSKDWQIIARKRFKDKIKTMKTERERVDYIIEDLTKFGYKWLYKQRAGFRPEKNKNGG
ncbi:MAG TPA: hypothetical protein ENG87_05055 [Candidatus Pacearchaeota archaeon]|nr:hypothetical protein [Candidatus Pacearchaeota archaeon]